MDATSDPYTAALHLKAWSSHAVSMAEALAEYRIHGLEELVPSALHRDLLSRDVPGLWVKSDLSFRPVPTHGAAARAAMVALGLAPFNVTAATVIADESAAWVWCGGTPPPRIVVNARERLRVPDGVHARQAALNPGDITEIAGCPVMAPHRAFAELMSRRSNPYGQEFARRLVLQGWVLPEELHRLGRQARKAQRAAQKAPRNTQDLTRRWGAARYYALARTARKILAEEDPTTSSASVYRQKSRDTRRTHLTLSAAV